MSVASIMGRPSTYPQTDEGIEALIKDVLRLASEGRSITQISARTDIPKTTLLRWADDHPDFRTTLTRAKELEQAFWEDQALDNLKCKDFNANLWNKSMSARFKSEYGDRVQVAGDQDAPLRHDIAFVIIDPPSA